MLNITLNISSQTWLIVGGGQVATRRTKKILAANGIVKVVSPVAVSYTHLRAHET